MWWGSAGHLVVEWRLGTITDRPAGGFSTPLRCTSWSTQPDQNSREVSLDLTRRDESVGPRMLPRESDVADDGPRQPQLPTGARHQPTPSVGGLRIAWAHGGPTEGLLEEPEGVLNGETAQIPVPEDAQVSWQRTADPGQPQWVWSLLHLWQAFDLDADHAERRARRAANMQVTPDIDVDFP